MCDFGESLQLDAQLYDGDAAEYHNRYPEEWARLNSEAVAHVGKQDDIVYFMRAGSLKSPQYTPLFWLGDQLQSWDQYDGFKSAVFSLSIGGFSGLSLNHADIGGYHYHKQYWMEYRRTKELFFRSCEFSAFTAAYRTHDGTNKGKSWQLYSDMETTIFFSRMAKVYVAWKFYRTELMNIMAAKGYPLNRHMYLGFHTDPIVFDLKYQFMVGTELLVAPVVDKGHETVSVYLPKGDWVHVWSDKVYSGPKFVTIDAPYGEPCVLYPQNSSVGQQFVQNLISLELRT